jgi:probable HAF family extracellular repeat protein
MAVSPVVEQKYVKFSGKGEPMEKNYLLTSAVVGVLAVFVFAGTVRPADYEITDLGVLTGGDESHALAVNESGQVVGWSTTRPRGGMRAFLWQDGVMHDLGALGYGRSEAAGINDQGQIVGSLISDQGKRYPFICDAGAMTELPGGEGYALSINNQGQAVGHSYSTNNGPCLWEAGVIQPIPAFGFAWGMATSINDRGRVVGRANTGLGAEHAFLWADGEVTDIGTLPGCDRMSEATAINNWGRVVGYSVHEEQDPNDPFMSTYYSRAFLWNGCGLTELGTLGGDSSVAYGINDRGQIVGWSDSNDDHFAFLYEHGEMIRLDSLLETDSGWERLIFANCINNKGQIVGTGYIGGQVHAFLMTPTPLKVATDNIEAAVAAKIEALAKIDMALAREAAALQALNELLAETEPNEPRPVAVLLAKWRIRAAIWRENLCKWQLRASVRKLESALALIGGRLDPQIWPRQLCSAEQSRATADINGDGAVDLGDLSLFRKHWQASYQGR